MSEVANLTFSDLIKVAATVLILLGAYNIIMTALKNHREEKKLKSSPLTAITEKLAAHDGLFAKDKARLDNLESDVKDHGEATRILLRQALAINAHLISGNDVNRLRESNTEIQDYLVRRK
jgi:hypothetical protein